MREEKGDVIVQAARVYYSIKSRECGRKLSSVIIDHDNIYIVLHSSLYILYPN